MTASATVTASPQRANAAALPGFVAGLRASWRIWLASRVAVGILSLVAARAVGSSAGRDVPGFFKLWDRWDVGLFVKVARDGYLSPAYQERTEVDFPGLPLLMRALHVVVRNWVATGLLVSLLAGLATSAALWSLAVRDRPEDPTVGARAVLAMVLFPYAVFLFAGYSEGLFLAGASCAWLAARQQRWWLAGLCACLSTASRSIGVAVIAALVVQYLVTERRVRRSAGWLALPLLPLVAYVSYLRVRTGHWDAYTRAESYWQRATDWPWHGLATTWHAAHDSAQASAYQFFWCAELAAALVGLLLTAALVRERRWAEAVLVGLLALIPTCSNYWDAGVRAILVAFPLYLWLSRHRRAAIAYAVVGAPLMPVFVVAFTSGGWVD